MKAVDHSGSYQRQSSRPPQAYRMERSVPIVTLLALQSELFLLAAASRPPFGPFGFGLAVLQRVAVLQHCASTLQ